ncbi:hypothetical protein ES332_A06G136200v1 [Gossypium tomentosum]|uniref:Cytochrome c oxidase subunit 5b n=1 Tax=Gossypium tomentosum TaxID=34277 RepID=A0A5D2Q6Z7_GOSTO|nr:hypothetical protein ES332_A06G136200v1 [Gossypium tomentosum]
MWRRLVTSHFKTLATVPCRSTSKTPSLSPLSFKSHVSPLPSAYFLTRRFSTGSAGTAVKKRVEDVMPIATGHELEELQAELEGKKILEDVNNPVGPFGTKISESPAVVKSYYNKRIV